MNKIYSFNEDKMALYIGHDTRLFNVIKNIFLDLGIDDARIDFTNHIDTAKQLVKEMRATYIISEFNVEGVSGFDFFKSLKRSEDYPSLHILVASTTSQAIVAKAAEEDVDAYLIKPLQVNNIKQKLKYLIEDLQSPSVYKQKIIEGKKLLNSDLQEARMFFEDAVKIHEKPSLAYFYLAKLDDSENMLEIAEKEYKQGLEINKYHFKCLYGLYENHLKRENFDEAYKNILKLIEIYPENEVRFAKALHLCIKTKNFQDIEMFYNVYLNLSKKDHRLTNAICSALYIAGKHFIMNENLRLAKKHFKLLKDNMENWKESHNIYNQKKEEIDFYLQKSA